MSTNKVLPAAALVHNFSLMFYISSHLMKIILLVHLSIVEVSVILVHCPYFVLGYAMLGMQLENQLPHDF